MSAKHCKYGFVGVFAEVRNEPSRHTACGVSGFVRMELLWLTDAQRGPGQTRMSH